LDGQLLVVDDVGFQSINNYFINCTCTYSLEVGCS